MGNEFGKFFVILGLLFVAIGLFLSFGGTLKLPGRLPGDIRVERENFSFFFPLATCLLISLLLSLIFWLFRR